MLCWGESFTIIPDFPPMLVSVLKHLEKMVQSRINRPIHHHLHIFEPDDNGMKIYWVNPVTGNQFYNYIPTIAHALGIISVLPVWHLLDIHNPEIKIVVESDLATISIPDLGVGALITMANLITIVRVYRKVKHSSDGVTIDPYGNVDFMELHVPSTCVGKFMKFAEAAIKTHSNTLRAAHGLDGLSNRQATAAAIDDRVLEKLPLAVTKPPAPVVSTTSAPVTTTSAPPRPAPRSFADVLRDRGCKK